MHVLLAKSPSSPPLLELVTLHRALLPCYMSFTEVAFETSNHHHDVTHCNNNLDLQFKASFSRFLFSFRALELP